MSSIPYGLTRPADFVAVPEEILDHSLVRRFEQIVETYPDRTAVRAEGRELSYRALNAAANQLAFAILDAVGEGTAPVAFLLPHDLQSIVALLAILKAGRPYMGLNASSPVNRMRSILADAGCPLLLSSEQYRPIVRDVVTADGAVRALYVEEIRPGFADSNPGLYVDPDSAFAVLYTSGSSGEAKGVAHSHRHNAFVTLYQTNSLFYNRHDRISLLNSLSVSAGNPGVLGTLMNGGTLCLYDLKALGAQTALQWIQSERLTILRSTPSVMRTILGAAPPGMILADLRLITLGGEPARAQDVEEFKAHTAAHCVLVNNFSSAETGAMAHYPVTHRSELSAELLPAGYPVPEKQITIVDELGAPVPQGETGEIVVRSRYLSSGYWNRPELTAAKFLSDPADPSLKTYYTGDRGRWRADGILEAMGRGDNRVKIRGFSFQLEAVELALETIEGVRESAAVVHNPPNGRAQLVAYLVAAGPPRPNSELQKALAADLADFMLPSMFVWLDALPRTATGKINRKALPMPLANRPEVQTEFAPAQTETEQQISRIWQDILQLEAVGVHDNFFELGGDSLMVLSMTLQVEKTLGHRIPQSFFKHATISNLARSMQPHGQQKTEPQRGFVLDGYRSQGVDQARRQPFAVRRWFAKIRGRVSALRRTVDESFIFEWILFHMIQGLTFARARALVFRMANQPVLLAALYRRKHSLFDRLLNSLEIPRARSAELFRLNFINNLLLKMMDGRHPFSVHYEGSAYAQRRATVYVRDRKQFIESTPIDRLDEFFPVEGFSHLEDAYREKRGVIVLSFHGSASIRSVNRNLARRLGSPQFQTIAHNDALKQSQLWGWRGSIDELPPSVESAIYAELAYHGQRLLQDGEVIHIAADLAKGPGRMFSIVLGDRVYAIKAGFAELALHTGASIIPVMGRYVEGGRLLSTVQPRLEPGTGSREEQIDALIRQYSDFMNTALKLHPEMVAWHKMRNHLRLPRAPQEGSAS